MWFTSSCGRIEIQMTLEQAKSCTHPGPCDADVRTLSNDRKIRKQLEAIDPAILRQELSEYGAWDEVELSNHTENLQRILWIAAVDITERHWSKV